MKVTKCGIYKFWFFNYFVLFFLWQFSFLLTWWQSWGKGLLSSEIMGRCIWRDLLDYHIRPLLLLNKDAELCPSSAGLLYESQKLLNDYEGQRRRTVLLLSREGKVLLTGPGNRCLLWVLLFIPGWKQKGLRRYLWESSMAGNQQWVGTTKIIAFCPNPDGGFSGWLICWFLRPALSTTKGWPKFIKAGLYPDASALREWLLLWTPSDSADKEWGMASRSAVVLLCVLMFDPGFSPLIMWPGRQSPLLGFPSVCRLETKWLPTKLGSCE